MYISLGLLPCHLSYITVICIGITQSNTRINKGHHLTIIATNIKHEINTIIHYFVTQAFR